MLLYNWPKIYKVANGQVAECVRIFDTLTSKVVPYSKYDRLYHYSSMNFSGNSFLLHPDVLQYNSYQYKDRDICIYLALASLRSLAAYKVLGTLTLPVIHSPVDPRDSLDNIKLLPIKDGLIHFLYEEV